MEEPQTLKAANDSLNDRKHRLSVWEAVANWLDTNFVSKDGRTMRSGKGLRSPGATPDIVPEEVIEEILTFIGDGPISQLNTEITMLENQKVVVIGEAKGSA